MAARMNETLRGIIIGAVTAGLVGAAATILGSRVGLAEQRVEINALKDRVTTVESAIKEIATNSSETAKSLARIEGALGTKEKEAQHGQSK